MRYYELRGVSYTEIGDFERGISDFKELLRIDAHHKWGQIYLSEALFNVGRFSEAVGKHNFFLFNYKT